jgi:hypothetical protein
VRRRGRRPRAAAAGGTWGKAQKVPGPGGTYTSVYAISCASAGNCSAGGEYSGGEVFVVTQTNGTWGQAEEVPGTGTLNTGGNAFAGSVSCTAPGDCSVAGNYSASNGGQAYVATETNGTWGRAKEIPGLARLSGDGTTSVNSVSCPAPGDCGAFGTEWNGTTNVDEAFVVNEKGGTWGNAQKVAGLSALGTSPISWAGPEDCYSGNCPGLSCPSMGNCTAAGSYVAHGGTNVFVVSETNGTWGKVAELPGIAALNLGKDAEAYEVSCGSAGNCSVGGEYASRKNYTQYTQAFVADQSNGSWGTAEEVPGTGTLNTQIFAFVSSLSCASDGGCAAGGIYHSSTGGGFVADKP